MRGAPLFLVFLFACSTLAFDYDYYSLRPEGGELRGVLIAKDPKNDTTLAARCTPDSVVTGKCVVVPIEELQRIEMDRADLIERLKACESSR